MHLLVIDDEPTVRRSLSRTFARRGWTVTTAASQREALALGDRSDCAIIDVDLQDGDGVALAERLLGCGRARRVVFYSAREDLFTVQRAARSGRVVRKGGALAALFSAVERDAGGASLAAPHALAS